MINRMMLSEQIKEALLDAILTGKYQPGDRLVESQIAKEMGTSQSPVREALRDLVAMRFVEMLPYKGARVREVDPEEVFEIYPVRAALEELAGRLAAGNVSEDRERMEQLEAALRAMQEAADDNDVHGIVSKDVEFHRIIVDASGNGILTETWHSLMIESRTFVTAMNLMISDIGIRKVAEMHRPIIDELRSGDPDRCGAVMREHVEAFGVAMKEVYRNGAADNRSFDAGSQRDDAVSGDQADQHRDLRRLGTGGKNAGHL